MAAVLVLTMLVLAFWTTGSSGAPVAAGREGGSGDVNASIRDYSIAPPVLGEPDELIVKFKDGTVEVRPQSQMTGIRDGGGVGRLRQGLESDPAVEYVEPNYRAWALGFPNDPLWSRQWNFRQVNASAAWLLASKPGNGVIVAVLDTGVAFENYSAWPYNYRRLPDLAGTEFASGYDFVNNDKHPNDDQGHGTHVAGIIAQTTNNGYGAAGLAYRAKIMPVKVLDSQGFGTAYDIASGIRWAADGGAKVINLSLGLQAFSRTVEDAIAYARAKNVTIVAAAGNGALGTGYSGGLIYPASSEKVISVGATGYDRQRAGYSQFGGGLDLVAPGGTELDQNHDGFVDGILQETIEEDDPSTFTYFWITGTSQAAPHVSAAVAMLIARGLKTPGEVYRALTSSAQDAGSKGHDKYYGYGILDIYGALMFKQTSTTWYFAEGFTADRFNTKILIANPTNSVAKVRAVFTKPGGAQFIKNYTVRAGRRYTIHVDSIPGLRSTGVSTYLESTNGVGIIAERTMYFNYRGRKGGHATIGATAPARRWYLAEGSTVGPFETHIIVFNPGKLRTKVALTFTKTDGTRVIRHESIPAGGRRKVVVDSVSGVKSAKFGTEVKVLSGPNVVVERSMYFRYKDITGGHNTVAAVGPQTKWLFAEGTTRGSFETRVVVHNPARKNAVIEATFTRPNGAKIVRRYKLRPGRRRTINIDKLPGFGNTDVSTKIAATNGVGVIAERVVYFNEAGRDGGHVTLGVRTPRRTWHFADGYTGGAYETWITIYNPRASAAKLTARFSRPNGTQVTKLLTVPPGARRKIAVDSLSGLRNTQFATEVTATNGVPFVAEKVVYFGHNGWNGGHATVGYAP